MNVYYSKKYNINLGILNALHPFDGIKFRKIYKEIKSQPNINLIDPTAPISMDIIDDFLNEQMQRSVRRKDLILNALELPNIPLLGFFIIDNRILQPMRWGIAGTMSASIDALKEQQVCWNISGGYHHATPASMQGFCIYNDIGICYKRLIKDKILSLTDKILIIDTDAHHGNGNAATFMDNDHVTILDVYNAQIYPNDKITRNRINIPVPLSLGTQGDTYLEKYRIALSTLDSDYRLVFVVAGSDVLATDQLGGLNLTIDDVVQREEMTVTRLKELGLASVMLGGGGYSKESAQCVAKSILACAL